MKLEGRGEQQQRLRETKALPREKPGQRIGGAESRAPVEDQRHHQQERRLRRDENHLRLAEKQPRAQISRLDIFKKKMVL
ncbi:hypothetical protein AMTR_s00005p00260560 [Amborella trichopoda]|uniref:Uncharacterized protein n=1 Tax=Amborella trichopoda TaxID=13333 RepID=W1PGS8_AMBTC|nr:hypothetical protein AMTR_s00005p00260560 [Amborella trichopoda]